MKGCAACGATISLTAIACPQCGHQQGAPTAAQAAFAALGNETVLMQGMNDQQRMLFVSQMAGRRKSASTGVLLAIFLGGLGAHHFYLGNNGYGIMYVLLCWTFLPAIFSLLEAFAMPNRVRVYNETQAFQVAAQVSMLGRATA